MTGDFAHSCSSCSSFVNNNSSQTTLQTFAKPRPKENRSSRSFMWLCDRHAVSTQAPSLHLDYLRPSRLTPPQSNLLNPESSAPLATGTTSITSFALLKTGHGLKSRSCWEHSCGVSGGEFLSWGVNVSVRLFSLQMTASGQPNCLAETIRTESFP